MQCHDDIGYDRHDIHIVQKRETKVGLIDLQKAYDSIDRQLLWEVLTRSGVPTKMLTIIRNFHEARWTRVRTDDGEHSAWF